MIPYGRQDIRQADIDAVTDVLRSDFLTQGPRVPMFEAQLSTYTGAEHAIAVNSATSALHIACIALGLGAGDVLWTSPVTFVASANCALYCGASVDFVDIDTQSYNMCADALEEKLISAKKSGKLPKIVVPVHLSGQSCDMERIHALSREYGFALVEDASHAVGGRYLDQPVGNCRYSDITVFSFHPVKIITTAEGGMALTNNAELAQKMRFAASHGITRDPKLMTQTPDGGWYYQQVTLGYNYRMTELQAGLGISQVARLDEYVAARAARAERYDTLLESLPLTRPWQSPNTQSAWHLYIVNIDNDQTAVSRTEVFDALRADGIGVNVHYIPVHLQPFYRDIGFKRGDFPRAEKYYAGAISMPLYPGLSEDGQRLIFASLERVLGAPSS